MLAHGALPSYRELAGMTHVASGVLAVPVVKQLTVAKTVRCGSRRAALSAVLIRLPCGNLAL